MVTVSLSYVIDGKLRVMVRTLEDVSRDEVIHLIDKLAIS